MELVLVCVKKESSPEQTGWTGNGKAYVSVSAYTAMGGTMLLGHALRVTDAVFEICTARPNSFTTMTEIAFCFV